MDFRLRVALPALLVDWLLGPVDNRRIPPKCYCRAPKKHISKNKDRDIPYNPPYNEAQ